VNDTYVTIVGNVVDSPRLVRLDNGAVTNFVWPRPPTALAPHSAPATPTAPAEQPAKGSADHPCSRTTGVRPIPGRVERRARTAFVPSGCQPLTHQGPITVVQHVN
jgi:hypothetical protein